jgi:hypothetical protein
MLNTLFLQVAPASHVYSATDAILSTGVVGACLVALAVWHILFVRKYDKRVDEMLKREREFQEIYAAITEKYRIALENVSKTLDVVVSLVKER